MNEKVEGFIATSIENNEQAMELMEKLLATARSEAVYGEPQTVGEHTVITASEVKVGMGFGYGSGGGASGKADEEETADKSDAPQEQWGRWLWRRWWRWWCVRRATGGRHQHRPRGCAG